MDRSKKPHILVIRLSAMGDVAMTVPVLLALTKAHPNLKITVLTKAFFKPIFSNIANVEVFVADTKEHHKGFLGLWKLYSQLRGLDITAVADLHNVLRSNILKVLFRFTGISVVQIDKGRKEKKALVAAENRIFRQLKTSHERYAAVFIKLGFPIQLSKHDTLPKHELTKGLKDWIKPAPVKYIGIAPFAAFKGKMYSLELMEEVLRGISKIETHQILLFGGGDKEKLQLELWEQQFPNCVSMVGKVSFEEELLLLSNLDLMLAMDSGNAHLASMYGLRTITLWGVTHPYAGFYPFGQSLDTALLSDREKYPLIPTSIYGNKVPNGYEKVMDTIAPEQVIQKIKQVLDKG